MVETDEAVVEHAERIATRAPLENGATAQTRRERVLILGRTRAGKMLCVGGMTDRMSNIRLKRDEAPPHWFAEACPFHVGDVFTIVCSDSSDSESPHHREDVRVHVWQYEKSVGTNQVLETIEHSGRVREGPEPWLAFRDETESGPYFKLSEKGSWVIPKPQLERTPFSVAFWRPTVDLHYREKYYWGESQARKYRIPFVGTDRPKEMLPAGTLVRLSTSSFFKPVYGAALQLSGWFI
jgi:hypothetical protein